MDVARNPAPERFVYLRDQQPLDAADWAVARTVLAHVRHIHDVRPERIEALGLDKEVWLPAANWQSERQAAHRNSWALFEPQNLPLLRILSHHFTGYWLGWLGQPHDAVPGEPPEQIDERLATLEKTADNRLAAYFSKTCGLPDYLHISPPARFGEVGWQCQGKLINHDTVAYLERVALLFYAGLLSKTSPISLLEMPHPRILEIGGGYGGLAHHIKQLLPRCRYTIVDLPESLAFSSAYLSVLHQREDNQFGAATALHPSRGFSFVPNYEFPALVESGAAFDLVINTLSLSEMSVPQIRAYCAGIQRLIGQDGFFFEQNQNNHHLGLQFAPDIVQEYFYHRLDLGAPQLHHEKAGPDRGPASRGSAAVLEQGFASVWANRPIPPVEKDPRAFLPPPAFLTGEFADHNVLRFGATYYALPKSAGPVDFRTTDVSELPGVYCDSSREAVEAFCRSKTNRAIARSA